MTIIRNLRQTIIDHDPKTGAVVGATQIFQRHVEVDGKSELLPAENEDLPVDKVPSLWGGTSEGYADKLKETSEILQAERDGQLSKDEATAAQITLLQQQLEVALAENDRLKSIIHTVQKAANNL